MSCCIWFVVLAIVRCKWFIINWCDWCLWVRSNCFRSFLSCNRSDSRQDQMYIDCLPKMIGALWSISPIDLLLLIVIASRDRCFWLSGWSISWQKNSPTKDDRFASLFVVLFVNWIILGYYTSNSLTFFAWLRMKCFLLSVSSPIRILNNLSASSASSIFTFLMLRLSGFMVVSANWS